MRPALTDRAGRDARAPPASVFHGSTARVRASAAVARGEPIQEERDAANHLQPQPVSMSQKPLDHRAMASMPLRLPATRIPSAAASARTTAPVVSARHAGAAMSARCACGDRASLSRTSRAIAGPSGSRPQDCHAQSSSSSSGLQQAATVHPGVAARTRAQLTMKPLPSGNADSLIPTRGVPGLAASRYGPRAPAAAGSARGPQSRVQRRRLADETLSERHANSRAEWTDSATGACAGPGSRLSRRRTSEDLGGPSALIMETANALPSTVVSAPSSSSASAVYTAKNVRRLTVIAASTAAADATGAAPASAGPATLADAPSVSAPTAVVRCASSIAPVSASATAPAAAPATALATPTDTTPAIGAPITVLAMPIEAQSTRVHVSMIEGAASIEPLALDSIDSDHVNAGDDDAPQPEPVTSIFDALDDVQGTMDMIPMTATVPATERQVEVQVELPFSRPTLAASRGSRRQLPTSLASIQENSPTRSSPAVSPAHSPDAPLLSRNLTAAADRRRFHVPEDDALSSAAARPAMRDARRLVAGSSDRLPTHPQENSMRNTLLTATHHPGSPSRHTGSPQRHPGSPNRHPGSPTRLQSQLLSGLHGIGDGAPTASGRCQGMQDASTPSVHNPILAQSLHRLQGEYANLVQRHAASEEAVAERRRRVSEEEFERQRRTSEDELRYETIRIENASLRAEVAALKAQLVQTVATETAPDQVQSRALLTNVSQAIDALSAAANENQLDAMKFVAPKGGDLLAPYAVQTPPDIGSATLERMRLHELAMHRKLMAVRIVQGAARAWQDRRRMSRKRPISPEARHGAQPRVVPAKSGAAAVRATVSSVVNARVTSGAGKKSPPPERAAVSTPSSGSSVPHSTSRSSDGADKKCSAPKLSRFFMPPMTFASSKERDALIEAGRLDRQVGEPSPAVFNAMEREHSSEVIFSTQNVQDTSPRIEWLYVICQEVGSRLDRLQDCTPQRIGWRLDDFMRCDVARKAGLLREEVIALRLHTGPMSDWYNGTLRNKVHGAFTTTIHAISSAVVKLASLQKATTVYRIMSVPSPESFLAPNASGSRTCCEPAFMSTTANRHFALRMLVERRRARQARKPSDGAEEVMVLLRIRIIPTDQAGDVCFASQSPGEEEVIFAPLTAFDVVDFCHEEALRATVADLRPRRRFNAKTIDDVIGKTRGTHIEFLDSLIDDLRVAGVPEPSLLPLNSLRFERTDQDHSDRFNLAGHYIDYTRSALDARESVMRGLCEDSTWQGETMKDKDIAQRMLSIVASQARAGEHDAAIEMTKQALKRASLPAEMTERLERVEIFACAMSSNQSIAVIKPSAIKKLFPPAQHSILEGAIFFLSLGMVPPWPPLMAALLAKMSPASHLAFGEMVHLHREACTNGGEKCSNVLLYNTALRRWEQGIRSTDGTTIRVGAREEKIHPSLRLLWPTDAGVGALLNEAAGCGDLNLVNTLLLSKVELHYSDDRANTTLHRAVAGGHRHVCRRLMEANADANLPNADGLSAWDLTLRGGNALFLVRRVFSPSAADCDTEDGPTPAATVSDHLHERQYVRELLEAAMACDPSSMASVITRAGSLKIIDTPNSQLVTPLMFAARCSDGAAAVQMLLESKAKVQLKTRRLCSALSMAAEEGHLESVRLLLKANAWLDMDSPDTRGYTALHTAVENGHTAVAKELLNVGADARIPRNNGWTCIMSAAYHGSTSMLQHLVEVSGDVNATLMTASPSRAKSKNPVSVGSSASKATKACPVNPGGGQTNAAPVSRRIAPIHLAAYNGFHETIIELGRLGAKVDQTMGDGWTALMVAAAQGHTKSVTTLMAMHASLDHQTAAEKTTALMAAASQLGAHACVGLLLQAKASVHLRESRGLDALMLAARAGNVLPVQQLLLQRADPKATRPSGATALMDASALGSEVIVKHMIAAGADVGAVDDQGQSALIHATKVGNDLVLLPLLQAGADVDRVDKASMNAIAHARTAQVARRLLESGASSAQLSADLCETLGLPLAKLPMVGNALMASKTAGPNASDPNERRRVGQREALSKRSPAGVTPAESVGRGTGVTARLRAGEQDGYPLRAALTPLCVAPTLPDNAPLLQLYPQNASKTQIGGATLIQLRYRELRYRRSRALKQRFYMPKGGRPEILGPPKCR